MSEKSENKLRLFKKKQTDIQYDTITEDRVHLRDFLGIKPGVYLTVIYSLILLVILFFILILPGLKNPGSLVILKTEPSGAALRVDGVYMGTSPDKIFVSKGTHTLELVLPGFSPIQFSSEIPGRIFGSLFFPRRFPLELELTSPDTASVLIEAAKDYAAWTFAGEPTASWQIPLSLSEGVYRIAGKGDNANTAELLAAAARFAVTKAALRDLIRAFGFSGNSGLSPSPLSLCQSVSDAFEFLSQAPGAALYWANFFSADTASLIESSAWYSGFYDPEKNSNLAETDAEPGSPPINSLNLGGLDYTRIRGGILFQEPPYSGRLPIQGFLICTGELTKTAYDLFLGENPQWNIDQTPLLVEQGLASGNYLIDDKPAEISSSGICSVSWYAAQAYCQWLSGRLPPSMAAYEVRLPYESEWEYALAGTGTAGTPPNTVFSTGLWEWCADPYSPLDFIPAQAAAIQALGSPERSLRGWINSADTEGLKTRASLPPDFCSSFVSFRPVIALKNQNG